MSVALLIELVLEVLLAALDDLRLVAETWACIISSVGMTWSPTGASISGGLDVSCACLALLLGGGMYVFRGSSSRNLVGECFMVRRLQTAEMNRFDSRQLEHFPNLRAPYTIRLESNYYYELLVAVDVSSRSQSPFLRPKDSHLL